MQGVECRSAVFRTQLLASVDTLQNNIRLLINIIIPKMQYGKALFLMPLISSRIMIANMLTTVLFNNQLIYHTDKINDKWAD
jgi:hypothetical protein